jgi:hypothetical protein
MLKWINNIRIGLLHAKYHRLLRRAEQARENTDLIKFKKYVYKAEDAWRKLVIIIEKQKENNG